MMYICIFDFKIISNYNLHSNILIINDSVTIPKLLVEFGISHDYE